MQIYEYLLAEAAARFTVALAAWVMMSNHHHLVVQDLQGNISRFNTRLHWLIARAMKAHRGWRENFWSSQHVNVVRLVEPHDAFARLVYTVANPVRANAVGQASEWGGASSLAQNLGLGPKIVARPGFFRANGGLPDRITLHAARVAGFDHLSESEWRAKVGRGVALAEEMARMRRAERGQRVRGMAAILADAPEDSPSTVEPRVTRVPELACTDPKRRRIELQDLRGFQFEHRVAWRALHDGERDVVFPQGSCEMRALAKKPDDED